MPSRRARIAGGGHAVAAKRRRPEDDAAIRRYCNRALLLENGRVVIEGEPDDVVTAHRQHTEEAKQRKAAEARAAGLAPESAAKGR